MRGYGGRNRWPDTGELIGIVMLALIALWGAWFGVQSLLALWWPINVLYALAGFGVALLSLLVARALLNR